MASAATTGQLPHQLIWSTTNAVVASSCLHVVAELGVADHVTDEPVAAEEIAAHCGADTGALERVLQLLAVHGIFEAVPGGFRHTPASELLQSDHPRSMRAYCRMMALPGFAETFARLGHSIRTGAPAVETVEPGGLWAYLQARPDDARIFGEAMTARAAADITALVGAYDFTRFATIADIGGGRGHLLAAALEVAPAARGVLFELPDVVAALDVRHERLSAQAGDFFADPLPAADAYILMDVMHDWPDAECLAILSAIRRAAARGAIVLVVESILPEDGPDVRARTLDIIMLAVSGGRERTASQFGALFASAGFGEVSVISTAAPIKIVEATAV